MSNFVLEIFDDEGSKCSFYTVRNLDEEQSETEKFFRKFYGDDRLKPYATEIANLIAVVIGNKYGAKNCYFRNERMAQALPPKPRVKEKIREISIFPNSPLRLYCLKLSESCLVLFNGGEKTSQSAQDGKTSMVFNEANLYADKILKALNNEIKLSEDGRLIMDINEIQELSDIIL